MRGIVTALSFALLLALILTGSAAAETPKDLKGLYLIADYPSVTARPGTTATVPLRLQNYGLAPQRFQLSVEGVPAGWTATVLGGGQPVAAAMPAANASVGLQLRLDIPETASAGSQTLTIKASGVGQEVTLPLAVTLAKELPAKLSLEPRLPSLRGSPRSSFEFQLAIKNDSGRNLTISLAANAPRHFGTSFTEAYGSQELSSIPIEAGQSKDVKLTVRPPSSADAGRYPVHVTVVAEDATAKAELALEIVGQPQLQVSGRDGLVSMRAGAGSETTMPVFVANSGSAPADQVELSASAPSGWKIEFEPKTIDRIEPGAQREVQARITPSEKSLNGDYMTTIRAASREETGQSQFRVTVTTSTLWGMTGAGIIAAALLLMVGAIARFGRR